MPDVIRHRAVDAAMTVAVTAIADTLNLATVNLVATPTGGQGAKTYSWTVDGATTGIADPTAASTTYTPTDAGYHTAECAVTDNAGVVARDSEVWLVGDTNGWVLAYEANLATEAADDWTIGAATRTLNGVVWNIRNQAKMAAGSGTDGTNGLDLLCTGDHTLWFSGADYRGAVGLSTTIQACLTPASITYNSNKHDIALSLKWTAISPTTSAVYGAVLCSGAWSTTTTHVFGSVVENAAGTPRCTITQIEGSTDGNYVNGAGLGAYPVATGVTRKGRTAYGWKHTALPTSPKDNPTSTARGSLSITDAIDVATVWADSTDQIGAVLTNAGVGTSAVTLAKIQVWVKL